MVMSTHCATFTKPLGVDRVDVAGKSTVYLNSRDQGMLVKVGCGDRKVGIRGRAVEGGDVDARPGLSVRLAELNERKKKKKERKKPFRFAKRKLASEPST